MLGIPTTGFGYSDKEDNVELGALCDWIEGSALFDEEELSDSAVVDSLHDGEIYSTQEMAWAAVGNAWRELRRRIGWLGAGSTLTFDGNSIKRKGVWTDAPAHAFCLCLSFAKLYPDWSRSFGADYTEQGELFEALTIESLKVHFPEWEIHATGWSRNQTDKLNAVVTSVAGKLGEPIGDIERWTSEAANEAGLDILCYRTFEDLRTCSPVFLLQCASGKHYEGKLHTPNLRIWAKIIQFTADPKKAFSTPYGLTDDEFTRVGNLVDGMLLERYRLLSARRHDVHWPSKELSDRILDWLAPRIAALPHDDE